MIISQSLKYCFLSPSANQPLQVQDVTWINRDIILTPHHSAPWPQVKQEKCASNPWRPCAAYLGVITELLCRVILNNLCASLEADWLSACTGLTGIPPFPSSPVHGVKTATTGSELFLHLLPLTFFCVSSSTSVNKRVTINLVSLSRLFPPVIVFSSSFRSLHSHINDL